MVKVKVSRTLHGNVKIVLDPTSALKLARILTFSDAIGDGAETLAAQQCKDGNVEELSWELHGALLSVGADHENL